MPAERAIGCAQSILRRPGVANDKVDIYNSDMDISVTAFKQRCLEIIRRIEKTGTTVTITRRGRIVARLQPPPFDSRAAAAQRPWERLRGSAVCLFEPGESVLENRDFEALR